MTDPRVAALAAALRDTSIIPEEHRGSPAAWANTAAALLAGLDGWTLTRRPPEGTRLILATTNVLPTWGTRTDDGRRLTAEWGEPDSNGWYQPTFTATGEQSHFCRHSVDPVEGVCLVCGDR